MPQYAYTVINKENRQLNGTIQAPDETSARKELNMIGFSVLSLTPLTPGTKAPQIQPIKPQTDIDESSESTPKEEDFPEEQIITFEFEAQDRNNKPIIGTIQAENIHNAYKRLIEEYRFNVEQLYPAGLGEEEIKRAKMRGVDELRDKLLEENMEKELEKQKKELNEIEFAKRQTQMKAQVDFVLAKVKDILNTYEQELDPTRKSKIKYFVEKILRIRNSTNLDYIKQSCEDLLTYLQKEEIFLNQAQRIKEKTQLSVEAKSMMMALEKINNPAKKDIFDSLRKWRQEKIVDNSDPIFYERIIDILITPLIGSIPESSEITAKREKIRNTNSQLKEFIIIYFQSPNPEFKEETKRILQKLWLQRKTEKKELKELIQKKQKEKLKSSEPTSIEILEKEIFSLAGWVLTFYIIYYFTTIYLNTKKIDFIPETGFNTIFQTPLVKYFFTTLFLFVCFLGMKIEFFHRKAFSTPLFVIIFFISSTLIILNF